MPEPFTIVRSIAAPFLQANVDTDLIIRVERLFGAVPREKLGDYALETLRYRKDGMPDPSFPLNDPRWRGAEILIAGENFGCGSAREGAVWALRGMGFRAILAPSFGDIFVTNCYVNGVLPIVLPPERIATVVACDQPDKAPKLLRIDLKAQTVTGPDGTVDRFAIPALRRQALLEGLDDIALSLSRRREIDQFRTADEAARPWVHALSGR